MICNVGLEEHEGMTQCVCVFGFVFHPIFHPWCLVDKSCQG